MNSTSIDVLKLFLKVLAAFLSNSLAQMLLKPASCKPFDKPPHPANKSIDNINTDL